MTVDVNLQEFRLAYVAEVEELLAATTAHLLEIERGLERGRDIRALVRDVLRAVHTIKGLSAMMAVQAIVDLAHDIEAQLRSMDRGRATPTAVQTLLDAAAEIGSRLRAVSEGQAVPPPPLELLARLRDEAPASDSAAPRPHARAALMDEPLASRLEPEELQRLEREAVGDVRAVLLKFYPSPAKALAEVTINEVRRRLAIVMQIVRVLPVSVPASPKAPGALGFAFFGLTSAPHAALVEALGDPDGEVRTLLAERTEETAASAPAPGPGALPPLESSIPVAGTGQIRVDARRLDEAIDRVSEMLVTRSRIERAVLDLRARGVDTRELQRVLSDSARQLRDTRSAVLRLRMVPMSEVLDRLPLVVRDLRRTSGKVVHLDASSGDVELDKAVAERLFPVFVHLLRNAVDHAIEPASERRARGKPEEGTVRVHCTSRANGQLEVVVSDDGGGVDRVRVAARAQDISADADESALLDALCRPGFSTRDAATTTSGRGVGMDIVRRAIVEGLGGELSMQTAEGKGTSFVIRVPVTIAVLDAFTLRAAGRRFVVPVSNVDEIAELCDRDVVDVPTRHGANRSARLIRIREESMPLIDLCAALRMEDRSEGKYALVVRRGRDPVAFALDRVTGQVETVVRPVEDPLVRVPGISGTADLGDGVATLVLDVASLAASFSLEASA